MGVKVSGNNFVEDYEIGTVLGEGAFGVVSACTRRSTGKVFAVKMVDKVETPLATIKAELFMMQKLNHPNVVRCHAVYNERFFVCFVMDKFDGDLVGGLQWHLKEKGLIDCQKVVPVMKQMATAIQYLHSMSIAHRDVKGDNYLMDRRDMTDPACLIVLIDFGVALQTKPGERLVDSGQGTKIFWPPELYERNYSLKVDIWAMGIIFYGLIEGRFPFRDQHEVRNKDPKFPKRVPLLYEEFVRKHLHKSEHLRFDAEEVLQHPWIVQNDATASLPSPSSGADGDAEQTGGELREPDVNNGIKQRRQELIHRLHREHNVQGSAQLKREKAQHYLQRSFSLADKSGDGSMVTYEWWGMEKAAHAALLDVQKQATLLKNAACTPGDGGNFERMLEEFRINPRLFGVGNAKTLAQLTGEVSSGSCRLMLDATEHKKMVRVVDTVMFRLWSAGAHAGEPTASRGAPQRLLIETEECYPDGRKRVTNRLPGTKKEPHESAKQTAERILQDMLNLSPGMVEFDLSSIMRYEEEAESPSYPGVRTVYRKEIVEAFIKSTDSAQLAKIGLPNFGEWSFTDEDGNTKTFNWMTERGALSRKVKLKASGIETVSALVRAPTGLNEEQLRAQLVDAGLDITLYGHGGKSRSLKEFSAELVSGESKLVKCPAGSLMRVVDVVILILTNLNTGDILVQTVRETQNGHKTMLTRLPGAKCRPDENTFLCAHRILRRQLDIDENEVRLLQDIMSCDEEKASDLYPGVKTLYRKRLVYAELIAR